MAYTERIVWSNINLNYNDWKPDLQENYPELNDDELYQMMYELNVEYLGDERINLDIELTRPIIVIADIGRWNGRFSGYRIIKSGNIKDCLYSNMDMAEWYVDRYKDLRAKMIHHDGTNYYLYRVFKENISETQIDNLLSKIYDGIAKRSDITRLTRRLGDEISKVYGW